MSCRRLTSAPTSILGSKTTPDEGDVTICCTSVLVVVAADVNAPSIKLEGKADILVDDVDDDLMGGLLV